MDRPKTRSAAKVKILLGYWSIRGLAQHIRNMLEYVGEEYEDRRYEFLEEHVKNVKKLSECRKVLGQWAEDRASNPDIIGSETESPLAFPDVPYYIETHADGTKFKLTQNVAIMKHIARRNGLIVKGAKEISTLEQYEQQAVDLRLTFINYCYDNPMATGRYPNFIVDIKSQIAPWNKVLMGKQWLMEDKLTYADFLLYEVFDWFELLKADFFDAFPALKAYMARFREIPEMADYFASPRYQSWPIMSPFAINFGWHEHHRDRE